LEAFDSVGEIHGRAKVLTKLANIHGLRGRRAAALADYDAALQLLWRVDDYTGIAHLLSHQAVFRMRDGETALAGQLLDEALALSRQVGGGRIEAQVRYRLAELHLLMDELDAAEHALRHVLSMIDEFDDRIGRAYVIYGLGAVQQRKGDLQGAERTYRQVCDLAKQTGERFIEAQAIHALGEIALANGRHTGAVAHLTEANRIFDELGVTIWSAKSLVVLAEAHVARGDTAAASHALDHSAGALALLDSSEAARWLDRVRQLRLAMV
jgi:tetratricopeptide (TPR) repeat protein